jgi:polyhydroxyalkanoate synthesis regulator phasin
MAGGVMTGEERAYIDLLIRQRDEAWQERNEALDECDRLRKMLTEPGARYPESAMQHMRDELARTRAAKDHTPADARAEIEALHRKCADLQSRLKASVLETLRWRREAESR